MRKGIILAGGSGTRLWPSTCVVSKQLLPIYDKPMVYYSLSTLLLTGLKDILLISTPRDLPLFQELFGDGSRLGVSIQYAAQPRPEGLAQALLIGAEFFGDSPVALVLGDNLFFGHRMSEQLQRAAATTAGATIFAYRVRDPQRYGVVELDETGKPLNIEEKPARPRSHWAVVGLYFYDSEGVLRARELKPSARGELEITDLNRSYLDAGRLKVELLGRGVAWLDTGTHDALVEASHFVSVVENRQGLKIGSPEEAAYRMGFIDATQLARLAEPMAASTYGQYLREMAQEEPGL